MQYQREVGTTRMVHESETTVQDDRWWTWDDLMERARQRPDAAE